jgi:hypothetical protein
MGILLLESDFRNLNITFGICILDEAEALLEATAANWASVPDEFSGVIGY